MVFGKADIFLAGTPFRDCGITFFNPTGTGGLSGSFVIETCRRGTSSAETTRGIERARYSVRGFLPVSRSMLCILGSRFNVFDLNFA